MAITALVRRAPRIATLVLALASLLVLPGCWVFSVAPLYEENLAHPDTDLEFDQNLVGSWWHADKECLWTLTVSAQQKKAAYDLTVVGCFAARALPPTLPPSLPSATAAGFFFDLSGAPVAISTTRRAFCAKSLLLERLTMPHHATLSNAESTPLKFKTAHYRFDSSRGPGVQDRRRREESNPVRRPHCQVGQVPLSRHQPKVCRCMRPLPAITQLFPDFAAERHTGPHPSGF
jgi:hypothetical protein